jgi:general secretion pathway protein H
MPTSARGTCKSGGFTLVEILLVVVILAIAVAASLVTLQPGASQITDEARRMALMLDRLALEARISGSPTAWQCAGDSLLLWRWVPEVSGEAVPRGAWRAYSPPRFRLDEGLAVTAVESNGEPVDCASHRLVTPVVAAAPELRIEIIHPESGQRTFLRGDAAGRFSVGEGESR